jgi:hypothetical protein
MSHPTPRRTVEGSRLYAPFRDATFAAATIAAGSTVDACATAPSSACFSRIAMARARLVLLVQLDSEVRPEHGSSLRLFAVARLRVVQLLVPLLLIVSL